MVRVDSEMPRSSLVCEQGGNGTIQAVEVLPFSQLGGTIKMCKRFIFPPASSIGRHTHHGESEIYYVLEGTAVVTENNQDKMLHAGDAAVCTDGQTHSIKNPSATMTMQILAFIA